MTTRLKVTIAAGALIASYAFGRYSAPEKVRVETKTVEVESQHSEAKTDTNLHRDTTVTELTHPDGTREKVTHTTQDTERTRDVATAETVTKDQESLKEVTYARPSLTLSALAGTSLHDLSTPVYGGAVTKQVLGPISVGAWGLSTGVVGVSVGISL